MCTHRAYRVAGCCAASARSFTLVLRAWLGGVPFVAEFLFKGNVVFDVAPDTTLVVKYAVLKNQTVERVL